MPMLVSIGTGTPGKGVKELGGGGPSLGLAAMAEQSSVVKLNNVLIVWGLINNTCCKR
ncbi:MULTISPECIES: hypothetical protein [Croceibacter]|uniref:hypothetical protein n=1 Tax=Croceibacter TaxID=216431 RepID=UPI0023576F2E|nr:MULTISPECIES: hypothetical protein [Croceibacter]|tara:strand:- start:1247 stop:1420 length:174 start_codon:yes stop_codon:yes gene_type:complete